MNSFEFFTTKGGNSMKGALPEGKTEVFSMEKYIEHWYGKNTTNDFSKEEVASIEKSYLRSDAKTVVEFCNEQAMLEGTDGGD